MGEQQISVGRIVHYNLGGDWKPAIVTYVYEDVGLNQIDATIFLRPIDYKRHGHVGVVSAILPGEEPGHWRWPPRI